MNDIAIATGAQFISEEIGLTLTRLILMFLDHAQSL